MNDPYVGGLARLVDMLSDEVLRRGTGALDVGGRGAVYVVFGHPLHASLGEITGLDAVDGIRALLTDEPGLELTWVPGRTAGKSHSLSPADGILDRLKGEHAAQYGPAGEDPAEAVEVLGDLNLRGWVPGDVDRGEDVKAAPADPHWTNIVAATCGSIEGRLHRHAQPLIEVIQAAPPDPASILYAIQRARTVPVRAVSRAVIDGLLDDAEALVRERNRGV